MNHVVPLIVSLLILYYLCEVANEVQSRASTLLSLRHFTMIRMRETIQLINLAPGLLSHVMSPINKINVVREAIANNDQWSEQEKNSRLKMHRKTIMSQLFGSSAMQQMGLPRYMAMKTTLAVSQAAAFIYKDFYTKVLNSNDPQTQNEVE